MDEIFVFAALVGLFCVVVVPVLAIMALNKSGRNEFEIRRLRERITALEAQLAAAPRAAASEAETHPAVATPETTTPTQASPLPVSTPEPVPDPAPADEAAPSVWSRAVRTVREEATESLRKSLPRRRVSAHNDEAPQREAGGLLTSLLRWFMQGNPLAKIGVILLFLGLSFLLRYGVERDMLPLELRVAGAGVAALALLAFGWGLRRKSPLYALILRGGASGAVFIPIFGAFRPWQMPPLPVR
ncbi:MAG TPA: DUF2339 domain-containing protein, partial [Franconibacter helveticus]|nr:DUF2339 domain-containing protein [Franconibacter helveticus]